jgi:uncharacterized protein YkwD
MGIPRTPLARFAARVVGPAALLLLPLLLVATGCADRGGSRYPPASAKPRPLVASPAAGDWLDHLNRYRAGAGLPPVTENVAWSDGDYKHAVYIVKNDELRHSEDPDNACYTPEGLSAARQSNLAKSYETSDSGRWAIDTWMQSPFHAVGVLDPQLAQVGYGSYGEANDQPRMGAALNVISGRRSTADAAYPIFWPGNGATVPLNLHRGASPSPLTSCPGYTLPAGLPLVVQLGSGNLTPVVSATSFTQDGRPLDHCVFDETTYRNPDRMQQALGRSVLGARDAIVLVPRVPLSTGTSYTASVSVNGQAYSWSFTVADAAHAEERREHPGFTR